MKTGNVTIVPACLLAISLFFFAACSIQDEFNGDPEALYSKAAKLAGEHEYEKAIAYYNKALASDTLGGLSERSVLELNRKRHLEGISGEYYAAFNTTSFLEKKAGTFLSDSLRAEMSVEKATWLSELGYFRSAAETLARISSPSEEQRFMLAAFALRTGNIRQALAIYERFAAQSDDPVVQIKGFAGLLQCRMRQAAPDMKGADNLAMNIAALSGNVLSLDGDLKRRVEALRESAKSLQLLEKHRRNASYLLFRALMLAEQSRDSFLIQLLRYESNTVIVQKPVPYRETGDWFGMKHMQFAEAAANLRLGTSSADLAPSERIDVLRRGLLLFQNYMPNYPGQEMLLLEKNAQRKLAGLLIRESKIFELFDALQQKQLLALQMRLQNNHGYLELGPEHDELERRVEKLQREISGLMQRKANIFLTGSGYELNRPADDALQTKRGRLLALLDDVKKINPAAATVLQMTPVTLHTLQGALGSGQLLVTPVLTDSLYAVMTVGKREVGIAGTPVPIDSTYAPEPGFRLLVRSIANLPFSGVEGFLQNPDRLWFSRAITGPLLPVTGRYDHLLIVSDPLLPLSFLGTGNYIAYEKKISMAGSFREIVQSSSDPEGGKKDSIPAFFAADELDKAQLYTLFNPGKKVFLLWKPFGQEELNSMRGMLSRPSGNDASPVDALYRQTRDKSKADRHRWLFVTYYGSR
ncbi:MAG: hypothetical protein HGA57_01795 [Chlorobium limicola]|uniref:hypothetical protein n=1 Tax=Chlorobium limicola TaxID=1092 RepID=UPI0023F3FADF|nr:hypothetical protein [Chlorobium limicola]NTV20107.1 hypothetical protein [Chlorobium limicola]